MSPETHTQGPLVSILICNYNYGRFIAKAIDSALGQTYQNIEVIVVDDGSTDNSREVIGGYGERVRAIYQANGGQSSAFNAGFAASSGEIICLLDSDDTFDAKKVARVVESYREHPEAHFVFHALRRKDLEGNNYGIDEPMKDGSHWLDYRRRVNKFTAPPTSGLTFRRAAFSRVMPLPEELRIVSDNYIKFVMLALFRGYYLAEALGVLRLHGNNAYSLGPSDNTRAQSDIKIAAAIRKHFPELAHLADRLIAITLAKRWRGFSISPEVQEGMYAYLRNSSLAARCKIYGGAAGRYGKQLVEREPVRKKVAAAEKLQADLPA